MNRNLTAISIYLLLLSIITTQAQFQKSVDDMINEIFSKPQPSTYWSSGRRLQPTSTLLNLNQRIPAPHREAGGGKVCGVNKECVQRFLCNAEGAVVRGGENIIDIRMDLLNPCDYLEVCCSTGDTLTESKIPIQPVERHEGCGYRNPTGVGFRITGNKDGESEFGEFPWMVAIFREEVIGGEIFNIYECGGSVIAPNVVLTAAHCARNIEPHLLVARAGEWDTQTKQEVLPHQDARVKEIIRHENYNKGTLFNDVALLILETPFSWEENIRPICLLKSDANFDYSRCYATGWGKDKFGKDGTPQLILKKIDLPMVPHATCQANLRKTRLGRFFNLDQSFICAGGEEGKDACKGDGGSPLVCPDPNNPNRYYQAGIASWGIGCGAANVPGVYANVAYLRSWINQKLSARGIDFSHFTV